MEVREAELVQLGRWLMAGGYRFVTVTPRTHADVNERAASMAGDLRDIFGWNRPFEPRAQPRALVELLQAAAGYEPLPDGRWKSRFRFSTLGQQIFAHSSFPTADVDSVFFGPDSYRFVRAVLPHLPERGRLVDVGCGSGVGGLAALAHSRAGLSVVLADINPAALAIARVNAALAGAHVEVVCSDVLLDLEGGFDVIISNPPYLFDAAHRTYRDGGAHFGAQLSRRIVHEGIARLKRGGKLLLYSGAAIVSGSDVLQELLAPVLERHDCDYSYEEIDPDVFSEELALPAYRDVERIAAVLLSVSL